jgi:hypothetical protein
VYATIRSYASDGGLVDALVENEGEIRDRTGGIAGFRAYYMLRTSDGGAVSISIFDDAAGADASSGVAADWVRENVPDLAAAPPERMSGEVALSF